MLSDSFIRRESVTYEISVHHLQIIQFLFVYTVKVIQLESKKILTLSEGIYNCKSYSLLKYHHKFKK